MWDFPSTIHMKISEVYVSWRVYSNCTKRWFGRCECSHTAECKLSQVDCCVPLISTSLVPQIQMKSTRLFFAQLVTIVNTSEAKCHRWIAVYLWFCVPLHNMQLNQIFLFHKTFCAHISSQLSIVRQNFTGGWQWVSDFIAILPGSCCFLHLN